MPLCWRCLSWVTVQNQGPAQEEQPEKITLTFRHFWNKEHDKPVLAVFESIVRTYESASKRKGELREHRSDDSPGTKAEERDGDRYAAGYVCPVRRSRDCALCQIQPVDGLNGFLRDTGLKEQFRICTIGPSRTGSMACPSRDTQSRSIITGHYSGLKLEPPKTLGEIDEAIRVLRENDIIPFAVGNEDRWPAGILPTISWIATPGRN